MKKIILALLSVIVPSVALAGKPVIVATGDSYTRRTSCTYDNLYDMCDLTGQVRHELSYSTYLNIATKYRMLMSENTARGGDTCTTQVAYASGIWKGEARGILAQVGTRINATQSDAASILLGINDVNVYGVSDYDLTDCLKRLYKAVAVDGGRTLVAMTYPPVATTTNVWSPMSGSVASANVARVNADIRAAVTAHNASYPNSKVLLAETSAAWSASEVASVTEDGAHPNQLGAMRIARKWYLEVCGVNYLVCN